MFNLCSSTWPKSQLRADWAIKEGAVAPSAILRKLAAYKRQNRLDFALAELGRIESSKSIWARHREQFVTP